MTTKFRLVIGKGSDDNKALKHLVSRMNTLKHHYVQFKVLKITLVAPRNWVAVCEIEEKRKR